MISSKSESNVKDVAVNIYEYSICKNECFKIN